MDPVTEQEWHHEEGPDPELIREVLIEALHRGRGMRRLILASALLAPIAAYAQTPPTQQSASPPRSPRPSPLRCSRTPPCWRC